MARFSRIKVFQKMKETGLVPLAYNSNFEIIKSIVQACYDGGASVFEFTSRGDFAHELFGKLSTYCNANMPKMILGVGSVTDAGQASLYMQMGAHFVVTPVLREDIAIVCNRRKVMWSPGCGSLSEVCRAEEMGCELIKLFPGGVYGPEMIKAIKGPQPWTSIMPTGGIAPTEENLRAWFDAGATCVGMGSKLITKEIIDTQDFGKLENDVTDCILLIERLRS